MNLLAKCKKHGAEVWVVVLTSSHSPVALSKEPKHRYTSNRCIKGAICKNCLPVAVAAVSNSAQLAVQLPIGRKKEVVRREGSFAGLAS